MSEPKTGQQYTLKNQPAAILTVTRVWGEWNEVHRCYTHYVQYDIEHSDGRPASRSCYSTRGNWDLGAYNHDLVEPEPEPYAGPPDSSPRTPKPASKVEKWGCKVWKSPYVDTERQGSWPVDGPHGRHSL